MVQKYRVVSLNRIYKLCFLINLRLNLSYSLNYKGLVTITGDFHPIRSYNMLTLAILIPLFIEFVHLFFEFPIFTFINTIHHTTLGIFVSYSRRTYSYYVKNTRHCTAPLSQPKSRPGQQARVLLTGLPSTSLQAIPLQTILDLYLFSFFAYVLVSKPWIPSCDSKSSSYTTYSSSIIIHNYSFTCKYT